MARRTTACCEASLVRESLSFDVEYMQRDCLLILLLGLVDISRRIAEILLLINPHFGVGL